MASSDHLVVDEFLAGAEMAGQAFLRAVDQILRIVKSECHVLRMRLGPGRVRPQPCQRWAMTTFAAYPFSDIKFACLLLRRDIEGMAEQTFGRVRGIRKA